MQPFQDIYRKEEKPIFKKRPRSADESIGPSPSPAEERRPSRRESRRRRSSRRRPPSSTRINRWAGLFALAFGGVMTLFVLGLFQRYRADVRRREREQLAALGAAKEAATNTAEHSFDVGRRIAAWKRIPDAVIEAERLRERMQHEAASEKLREALGATPGAVELKKMLAESLLAAGRTGEALEVMAQVVEAEPHDLNARLALGRALAQAGDEAGSLLVAQWVLETDIYSPEGHQLAAQAYLKKDELQKALPHLRRLSTLDSGNLAAQNQLGEAYRRVGDIQQAVRLFSAVLKQEPGNMEAYVNLAACHAGMAATNLAVDILTQAVGRFGRLALENALTHPRFDPIREHPFFNAGGSNDTPGAQQEPPNQSEPAS